MCSQSEFDSNLRKKVREREREREREKFDNKAVKSIVYF